MRMGVFVGAQHQLEGADAHQPDDARSARRFSRRSSESVDIAKRVNAKWMTVVPGHVDSRPHIDYQTANVVETLKRACGDPRAARPGHGARAAQHAAQPSGHVPDEHAAGLSRSARRSRARRARSCTTSTTSRSPKGTCIPNINTAWDEIAYFQVGDNPGRNEPGTGEINYRNVFKHIHGKGFTGVVGMEHGNSIRGTREGERAVIDAYIAADTF